MGCPGEILSGKVGEDVNTEQAYDAAKLVGLNLISTLKRTFAQVCFGLSQPLKCSALHPIFCTEELGDLDRVKRIVKVNGFVNCVSGFSAQPKVINGISDLLGSVFGPRGVHARSALGVNALPLNVPVEIEAVVEVYPGDEVAPVNER